MTSFLLFALILGSSQVSLRLVVTARLRSNFHLHQVSRAASRANVRIVTEAGASGHVGVFEIEMKGQGYGTVCGMNGHSADVACRQLGYDYGVVSPHSCSQYGGASICGSSGSPVAVKNLQCTGSEISVDECKFDDVDDACLTHSSDSVVFCGLSGQPAFTDGELRLIAPTGAPALPQEAGRLEIFLAETNAWAPVCAEGFTAGSASVACKAMGFGGASGFAGCTKASCGAVPPHVASLACSGSESGVLQCPMSTGESVFCAPEESVVLTCAGPGDPIGKPAA